MTFDNSVLKDVKALVVDDDIDSCELITLALELQAVEVTAVPSVSEALTVFEDWQPDIIVSDIAMPKEDGYSFIQKIRALAIEEGGKVPAIALTAYVGKAAYQQALDAGFQRYIPKPIEPDKLIAVVTELLTERKFNSLPDSVCTNPSRQASNHHDQFIRIDGLRQMHLESCQ